VRHLFVLLLTAAQVPAPGAALPAASDWRNGNAAAGHFNPTGAPHGAPDAASHHAGDFGNVTADANGEVHTTFTTHSITINSGATGVVGHAIILHANADDLTSQPSGNAGARIACGVAEAMAMH